MTHGMRASAMSKKMNETLLIGILLPVFIKGCVYADWSSTVELGFAVCLVGFLHWYQPVANESKDEIKLLRQELESKIVSLQEQIRNFKIKVGFRDQITGT